MYFESFSGYIQVRRHCSEPQNRQTNQQITEIKIVNLRLNELTKN